MLSSTFEKEMRHAVEFIPNRLYYVALSQAPANHQQRHYFCIDNEMIYWNFYLDFGPLNLGHVYRFGVLMNSKLNDPKLQDKVIYFYSHTHAHRRANAAFLICSWALLHQNKSAEDAYKPFRNYVAPFPPWHDATPSPCTFNLTIMDTLRGLHKAREHQFFDFKNFDIHEYEFYEQVENGDLNWCMEKKFLAFAGPHAERQFSPGGYHTLRPEDYIQYFLKKNVTLVVRLNKPYYDAKKFVNHGINHMELYFLDGSNPTDAILQKFLTRSEETPGAVAVHCKAGLGRTGSCIAAYIMKHFRVTAEEIIGWLRIVRPGSVIGPQQHYLKDIQMKMWQEGDLMRTRLTSLLPVVTNSPHNSNNGHHKAITTPNNNNNSNNTLTNSGRFSPTAMTTTVLTPTSRPNTSGSQGSSSQGSSSTTSNGNTNNSTTPYAPNTPQSSSSGLGLTRKLSKIHITTGSPANNTSNSSPSPSAATGRPITPKTLASAVAGGGSNGSGRYTPSTPTRTTSSNLSTTTSSAGSMEYGVRPSSRGPARPSTSGGGGSSSGKQEALVSHSTRSPAHHTGSNNNTSAGTNEEEAGGITQGDQLRSRRHQQQHIGGGHSPSHSIQQTTGVYALYSTPTGPAPGTPTMKNMFSGTGPGTPTNINTNSNSSSGLQSPGSASGTRPKSRLGSLLSSWKST